MSIPVTVRNDTDTDVVFRDRAGVRSVVPAGGTADVHRDDVTMLRGLDVHEVRATHKSDTDKPTSIAAAQPHAADSTGTSK